MREYALFFAFCSHYFGFADGLFILVIPLRAAVCKRRARLIGGSNRFKNCYQRCVLLQRFGSSDEASGEVVDLRIVAPYVVFGVHKCI